MKRIIGLRSKKDKPPPVHKPDINDVVNSADKRTEVLELKIADCDNQLRVLSQQIRRAETEASKLGLKQKARSILLRKKQLEQQAEQSRDKSFNLDSLVSSINTAEDIRIISKCLTTQTKQLKKDLKKINLDKIDGVQDELSELLEISEDVNSVLSKNYEVPLDIDDDELNNQLDLLGDEIVRDNDPSYIDAVINQPIRGTPTGPPPDAQTLDEFGLPILDTNSLSNTNKGPQGFNASQSITHNP